MSGEEHSKEIGPFIVQVKLDLPPAVAAGETRPHNPPAPAK
jgi:hypothetical protein